ncbi:hypothetical protein [Aneurinibacillus aneurinilyticus]|uniref:hypothetical protein n=1 Tax=Aneurinibacillus aneurinilyticus TaxID=1391 RepID=UPI00352521B4
MKKLIATTALLGATILGAPLASAASYSFTKIYNSTGPVTSDQGITVTNEKVNLKYWQESLDAGRPNMTYRVVRDRWWGWEDWSTPYTDTGEVSRNFPRSHTFQGVPNNDGYHIQFQSNTSSGTQVGGTFNP